MARSRLPNLAVGHTALMPLAFMVLATGLAVWLRFGDVPQNRVNDGIVALMGILILAMISAERARRKNRDLMGIIANREYKHRSVVELAPLGFFAADLDGRYTYVNRAGAEMLGYEPGELVGKSINDLISPEDTYRLIMKRDRLRAGGSEATEWNLRRKDGTFTTIEVVSKILSDGRWIAFTRDLSEVKKAEMHQRWVAARQAFLAELGKISVVQKTIPGMLRDIAELSVHYIADWCLVDIFPHDAGRRQKMIVLASQEDPSFSEQIILGCDESVNEDRFPQRLFIKTDVTPPDLSRLVDNDRVSLQQAEDLGIRSFIQVPLRFGEDFFGVLTFVRKDCNYTESDFHFMELVASRFALTLENIKNYQMAQHAITARDTVLSTVSHDLKNPLGGISIGVELLMMAIKKGEKTAESEWMLGRLTSVKSFADRGIRLIEDLLDVTTIESGRFRIRKHKFMASNLMKQVIGSACVVAQKKSIQVDARDLEAAFDFEMEADLFRLTQVFGNLIDNAVRYTPENGKVEFIVQREGGHVIFCVSDSGPGISRENLVKIFARHWQAAQPNTKHSLGLGLAIARGIVEAHGGAIWAESELGRGARFFIRLPIFAPSDNQFGDSIILSDKRIPSQAALVIPPA